MGESRGSGLRHKRATVALLTTMLIVHNAHRIGVVSVFDGLAARFSTDYAGAGTLFSAYVLGYAISQSAVGVFGDRFDTKRMLIAGLTINALFSAVFAWTHSYALALASRFIVGTSGALLYTPSMKMGITLFERQERGRVLGFLQGGAGVGSSGAMIAVPFVATMTGLSGGFLSLVVLTLVALPLAALVLPDAPGTAAVKRTAEARGVTRRLDFWQLIAINLAGMLAAYGLLTWLPTYLTNAFGYSEVRAGTLGSIPNIALMVAAPLVGMVADLPRGRVGVVVGGSAVAVLPFLVLIGKPHIALIVIMTVVAGASLAATTAPLMLFSGERFGPEYTARVVGLMATAGQIGATLAGTVFGFLLARSGNFQIIWIVCSILALTRLAALLNLVRRDRAARLDRAALEHQAR